MVWLSFFQIKLLILEISTLPGILNCADFEGVKKNDFARDEYCHLTIQSFPHSVWSIVLFLQLFFKTSQATIAKFSKVLKQEVVAHICGIGL